MKPLVYVGVAALGAGMAFACLPSRLRSRLSGRAKRRMMQGLERMIAALPEDAPPKLIMSVLPRLQVQNERIMALLQEQNELLRQQRTVR